MVEIFDSVRGVRNQPSGAAPNVNVNVRCLFSPPPACFGAPCALRTADLWTCSLVCNNSIRAVSSIWTESASARAPGYRSTLDLCVGQGLPFSCGLPNHLSVLWPLGQPLAHRRADRSLYSILYSLLIRLSTTSGAIAFQHIQPIQSLSRPRFICQTTNMTNHNKHWANSIPLPVAVIRDDDCTALIHIHRSLASRIWR